MDPIKQFLVKQIFDIKLFGYIIPITNSQITISFISLVCIIFMHLGSTGVKLIPTRMGVIFEYTVNFISTMLNNITQGKGLKFFPLIFALFLFIIFANLYGMIPGSFSVTSQFLVTGTLALITFIISTLYAIKKHKLGFFRIFLPSGTPLWMAPLMIIIEIFAYFTKPVSLSLRLAANMLAGHILIKVIASFGFVSLCLIPGLMIFELFVCILQAYIFAILTCVYLNDVIDLH